MVPRKTQDLFPRRGFEITFPIREPSPMAARIETPTPPLLRISRYTASLTTPAVSSTFFSTLLHALREERHFALVEIRAIPNQGSLVISFRSDISIRPMHLFGRKHDHDYYCELLFFMKRSRAPNQLLDVHLNTIAWSGLSCMSVWACGPLNLMKISSSKCRKGQASERRD